VITQLIAEGAKVLALDMTGEQLLAKGLEMSLAQDADPSFHERDVAVLSPPVQDVVGVVDRWVQNAENIGDPRTYHIIAIASIDPGLGAWHLAWATDSIVTVTAGRSSAQQVNATGALLRAAHVHVRSAVLLDADPDDETIGLLSAGPLVGVPLGAVVKAPSQ